MFNIRGDEGAQIGGLAVDTNFSWKGAAKYILFVAGPPGALQYLHEQLTERTWMGVVMGEELKKIMKTYVEYPPRKLQSMGYTGPITISNYEKFQWVLEELAKEGVNVPMPTGN